jgi:O-succinylbenzoate synthase
MSVIDAVELRRIRLPLVAPFRTSFGTQHDRDVLLVRVEAFGAEGWGECVAMSQPIYNEEYVGGAQDVLSNVLVPAAIASDLAAAADLARVLGPFHGNRMAKAALEMALLDAELRAQGRSFADALGAEVDRVPSGVSVGIFGSIGDLLETVNNYLGEGYRRIKLKIEPGWDLDVVSTVRAAFGPDVPLQVDANAAYTIADADHLARLDEFGLLLIEQPFAEDRLLDHARLAGRIDTPVCLDESITSLATCLDAIEVGATQIVNIKAGRVGGYLAARGIAEACAARDVAVWCGGMVETGLGRAANAALAAHPAMRLVGDVSASSRFFARDVVTEPAVLEDGHIDVPDGPGLGVEVDLDFLDEITTERRLVHA